MRLGSVLVLIGLALVGCSPSADLPKPKVQEPTPVVESPKPAEPTTPPGATDVTNPNRVYQLGDLEKSTLHTKGQSIDVWVMDTDAKRQEGLMFVTEKEIRPEQGMIFAFPADQEAGRGFWMHNTLIPLDIIYIAADGKVVHIAHGKVKDDTSLPCPVPFRSVLELPGGQAAKRGIAVGTRIEVPDTVLKFAS